jgi:putative membrane protein
MDTVDGRGDGSRLARTGLLLFGVTLVAAAICHVVTTPNSGTSGREGPAPGTLVGAAAVAAAVAQADPASHVHLDGPPSVVQAPPLAGGEAGTGSLTGARLVADASPAPTVNTPYGPLTAADRDLLVRVRQAGLWEMPAGLWAQKQGGTERVKEVGAQLMADHQYLDTQVRALAAKLGVVLPDQPNKDQQGWLAEMRDKVGTEFDKVFANRLRAAHGKVFAVIAVVRASTTNDLVRAFAQTSNTYVMKHMTLLESTGDVDYSALPAPVATGAQGQAATTTSATSLSPETRANAARDLLIVGALLGVIGYIVYRLRRPRSNMAHY